MDPATQDVVDGHFADRFGLSIDVLRRPRVSVVAARPGDGGVALFRWGRACVVVVAAPRVDALAAELRGADADAVFSVEVARRLAGDGAEVHGPSWQGYVTERTFCGEASADVERIDPSDVRLVGLRDECALADWQEGGFPLDPSAADPGVTAFYGIVDDGRLAAAGNMTEWRGLPADVGLVTRSDRRGEGLATSIAATMTAASLPTVGVVRYRALTTNHASLRVAARLGFEGYGLNLFARLPGQARDAPASS